MDPAPDQQLLCGTSKLNRGYLERAAYNRWVERSHIPTQEAAPIRNQEVRALQLNDCRFHDLQKHYVGMQRRFKEREEFLKNNDPHSLIGSENTSKQQNELLFL